MFRFLVALISLFVVHACNANDIGIGASFRSDESTIYVPLQFGQHVMVEPFLRYEDDETVSGSFKSSEKNTAIGIGIFGVKSPIENAKVYFGIRSAYVDQKSEAIDSIFIYPGAIVFPVIRRTDQDGYSIAPTIGFEYILFKRLSLGAEVAWEYINVDGTIEETFFSAVATVNTEDTLSGTRTNVILRFYF